MSDSPSGQTKDGVKSGIQVAICVDDDAFARLRPVIRHLCVGLFDHGARVRIVTPSPDAAAPAALGPVELVMYRDWSWPFHRRRRRQLVEALSARPPAVIYAFSAGSYSLSFELADAFDVEVVAQVSGLRDVEALQAAPGRRLAHVIGASEPLLGILRAREGLSRVPHTLVRPGVQRGSELTCFRNEQAAPTLVCTAGLDDRSGVDIVVEAVALVRDRGVMLLTFLMGTGPRERQVRKLVRERDLTSRMTFARPSGDITEVLRGADLYVMPPGDEDIFARPLQAMASGTAVICFAGSMADCFHDEETAIVCQDRTAAALAAALERLLRDKPLARRVADQARQYVQKNHQMSAMAEKTMQVFQGVALRRRTFRLPR